MKEVKYYVAEDGTRFEYEWDCVAYERKTMLENYKEHFKFFDYHKCPIFIEDATTENVCYIVIKTEKGAEIVGEWFEQDGCDDPFDGHYCSVVGTWYYGENEDRDDGWYQIENDIARLQNLLAELHQE